MATPKPRSSDRGRLSRSAEFERVYRQGRSTANRHLVVYAFPNGTGERPRLGLSVSRKVGGAVARNRVKRLLRESFTRAEATLRAGQDVVVVARPSAAELVEREGLAGIEQSLAELLASGKLRVSDPEPEGEPAELAAEPAATPEPAESLEPADQDEDRA